MGIIVRWNWPSSHLQVATSWYCPAFSWFQNILFKYPETTMIIREENKEWRVVLIPWFLSPGVKGHLLGSGCVVASVGDEPLQSSQPFPQRRFTWRYLFVLQIVRRPWFPNYLYLKSFPFKRQHSSGNQQSQDWAIIHFLPAPSW